ncbi:MAG: arylsulfotransferase family protein [Pseudomonadota bacterium]
MTTQDGNREKPSGAGIGKHLPLVGFMLSPVILGFLLGVYVGAEEVFPYKHIRDARNTLSSLASLLEKRKHPSFQRFSEYDVADLSQLRIESDPSASPDDSYLFFGGLNQYRELCPEQGCAAVHMAGTGEVLHAYPYRPEEIFAANSATEHPHEFLQFDPAQDMRPVSAKLLPGRDLLVIFARTKDAQVFPFGTGVARIAPDGQPRWYRFDYSHHWPSPSVGDHLLIPAARVRTTPVELAWHARDSYMLPCSAKTYDDTVQVMNPAGDVLEEISILTALEQSPFRGLLEQTTDPCDPLHLNFIDVVRDTDPTVEDITTGDWVLSLRNLSAFAIVDSNNGRIKRVIRGSFSQQHSVQHLTGPRYLLFDNKGGNWDGGPSRVLELDLATGSERTVFPTAAHLDRHRKLFQKAVGHLSISKDRTRVIATFTSYGLAFEIRLADGRLLREFRSIHDVSDVPTLAARGTTAAVFELFGVEYAVTD